MVDRLVSNVLKRHTVLRRNYMNGSLSDQGFDDELIKLIDILATLTEKYGEDVFIITAAKIQIWASIELVCKDEFAVGDRIPPNE